MASQGERRTGAGRRGGGRPRCSRELSFPHLEDGNEEQQEQAVEPTPGPSCQPLRPTSLVDKMKAAKAARLLDAKNLKKLTDVQKKELARLRDIKQVGNFKMPDASEPQRGKGKGRGSADSRVWVPCPLLPGVPSVPPPRIPQSWELQRQHSDASVGSTAPGSEKSAPGSGRSHFNIDIDEDFYCDFVETGEGSEVDPEDLVDISFKPRDIGEYPMDIDSFIEMEQVEAVQELDNAADAVLRHVVSPEADLLHFDWRGEPDNFEGVREVFTVPSTGPTFDNAETTPVEVFVKIWDANFIAHIVRETNRYCAKLVSITSKPNSRLSRWKDVTGDEIQRFIAILMLQSLVVSNVEREYWYPMLDELKIGDFNQIMRYNRFVDIKRCLHFIDNDSLPVPSTKLDEIITVIEHLNRKFSSLYLLEQNVAIDESLLLWKGRLTFAQKIATKRARVGIKSYELCESRTGYLWRMEVYTGKGHAHVAQVGEPEERGEELEKDEPESATVQIVLNLMRPLFNKGHTLIMDNFYNAPLLSRLLKVQHKTDSMGTLRLNREFVPEALKMKTRRNMKEKEVAFSTTKDLSVVVWMDKNIVSTISSFHPIEVGGIEKYGYYRYKPQVILDYNLSMGGIDHKDQMLSAYPIERSRNIIWYKKLFRRLLNVSIHNTFVMFNHNRTPALGHRAFRLQLAKELLQISRPAAPSRPLERPAPAARPGVPGMHLPVKNKIKQRCKLCNDAKVRRSTSWRCSTCNVNLCIDGCYIPYHINLA